MNLPDDIKTELRVPIHANYSLIYLTTWEEERALRDLAPIPTRTLG